MPSSIFSRKMDLIYLIFFIIHVPVVLAIDSYIFWPPTLIPQFMTSIRTFYIETYKDKFFTSPPPFFSFYVVMEILYHLPLSLYAISALLKDSPLIPLHLLIYAVQTGITTATCVSEALSWDHLTSAEMGNLMGLYLPYLGVSVVMGVDVFMRLSNTLNAHADSVAVKKGN